MVDAYMEKSATISYTADDVRATCSGKVNIVSYHELLSPDGKYDTIASVLGQWKAAIILIEFKHNVGHWVSLIQTRPGELEWFDSYGVGFEEELKFVPIAFLRSIPQWSRYESSGGLLHELVRRNGKTRIIWNKAHLQRFASGISTCGRWCGMRVAFFHKGLSLSQFQKFFMNQKFPPDWYITVMTFLVPDVRARLVADSTTLP